MENSQLVVILRSLSKSEFREFGRFVQSPYFNNRDEVIRLYDVLKAYYPQFNSKHLTKQEIFGAIYPEKKFSDVLMRKLLSLMINQAMSFLAISGLQENELNYNVVLVDKLREKKLNHAFEKKSKLIDELLKTTRHNCAYYESKFKYTSIVNGHLLHTSESSMVHRFQNEIDDFFTYFLSVVLLMYVRLSEWSKGYNINFDLKFYEEVLEYLQSHDYRNVPSVHLYYNMLMLLNTEEENYFFELLESSKRFADKIGEIDDYNVAIVLIQYCFKRVQKGDVEYRKHQFETTKTILERNMIPPGHLEPYFFTNTIRNAVCINEFNWSLDFIEKYKERLNPEFTKDIVNYSLSVVEFYSGNYEKALEYISTVNPERSFMKLDIRNTLVVIYYELDHVDELLSSIDAYKHFLARDQSASKATVEKSQVFIKFVSSLLKIKLNENYEETELLKREIVKCEYFNLKEWLLEKAEELILKGKK